MLRLVLSDLVANLRIWVGVLLVAAATAAVGTVAAAEIETAVRTGGTVSLALYAISGTVLLFATLTTIVVLGSVVELAVALQRRSYALWQLVGIGPGRVRLVVHAQLAIVALAGAVLGAAAVTPALPALFRFFLGGSSGLQDVRPRFGPVAAMAVGGFVLAVTTLSGARGARQAGRVPPLQSLRSADVPLRRVGPARWIGAAALLTVVLLVAATVPGTAPERLSVPLMLVAPLTAAALAAVGPALYPAFARGWTAAVPSTASAAWYLARNSVEYHVTRSTAAISPFMVAVALSGGLATATAISGAATSRATGADPGAVGTGTVVLLIGGPVFLALLGSTATILIASRSREREFALVQAAGSTRATVVAAAALEAVIYAVTAVALGAVAVAVTTLVGLLADPHGEFGWAAVGSVAAIGLALILAATVVPTRSAVRTAVPEILAAE